jgi:ribose/xylose/arabinose/galactoside ABC-type transport system permease subunit
MNDMLQYVGRFLVTLGVVIALLGALMLLLHKTGVNVPGRLPGDIIIQKRNFTIYFPITTSIVLSILLSIILYFVMRR